MIWPRALQPIRVGMQRVVNRDRCIWRQEIERAESVSGRRKVIIDPNRWEQRKSRRANRPRVDEQMIVLRDMCRAKSGRCHRVSIHMNMLHLTQRRSEEDWSVE